MKCLSIQQPWAHLIVTGKKDIENRTWETKVRGWVLVHAGKKVDRDALPALIADGHALGVNPLYTGGIVGAMRIDDCVSASPSKWFGGPFGFKIGAAVEFKRPLPLPGALGFFRIPPGWADLDEQLPREMKEDMD